MGLILQSKTNWSEQGKKLSKYFLNLEKRNKTKLLISDVLVSLRCSGFINQSISLPIYMAAEDLPPKHN